ncbi:MAG: hypothetical protein ACFE8L_13295, partial [Candidatus Hodarchaeota archaeon]
LILFSVISILPVVNGYDYIFDDAEDDVYQYCTDTEETVIGDYHDEIDIVNLNITGKHASFTVAGNISDWNIYHWFYLVFSENFRPSGPLFFIWTVPYYELEIESSFISLERAYISGETLFHEEWNGTHWENSSTATPANILNEVSQHSISAYIPDVVEEIPSSMKCLLYAGFNGYPCSYADYAPARPTSGGGDEIPGYNIFLLIGSMIGVAFFLLRKKYKKK